MGEPLGTTIVSPLAPMVAPETTSILLLAAAANSGGVLPTPPMSMAPALSASSSGGAGGDGFHLVVEGGSSGAPAAASSALEPPFWSPTVRVTLDRSTLPSSRTAAALADWPPQPLNEAEARIATTVVTSVPTSGRWAGKKFMLLRSPGPGGVRW